MTILGKHTVAETRDLIKATEFRARRCDERLKQVEDRWFAKGAPDDAQTQLIIDTATHMQRWGEARDKATNDLLFIVLGSPLVPVSALPSESVFNDVVTASTRTTPRIIDINNRIDTEAVKVGLPPVDLVGIPGQNSTDVDFAALGKLDAGIKAGESAAAGAAKSNTGLIIGAGVLGVIAVVVATKVYL